MSLWKEFVKLTTELINSDTKNINKVKQWNLIKKKVSIGNYVPAHFGNFMEFKSLLENKKEIKILDHGCGSGIKLCFLIAKGFKNVWGVTVNFENCSKKKKKNTKAK